MPTITLNNGVEMPTIALGTGGFDNASAAAAVGTAASAGLTHVHSAFDYYNLPASAAASTSGRAPPPSSRR